MLLIILIIVSAISFLYYGITFFTNSGMEEEFHRYDLSKFRKLIGGLQLLGGAGLFVGLIWPLILIIASGGLALLMLIGFGVRVKMKDGLLQSLPSFIFTLLNFYIFFVALSL
ncbi:putative membrane protein YphA (DoxX/SURF4 family) [Pedobacter sp. CG_S7]